MYRVVDQKYDSTPRATCEPRRKKGRRWYATSNARVARRPSSASKTLFLPIHPWGHMVSDTILTWEKQVLSARGSSA